MILRSGWQKNIVDSLYGIRNKPRQCCIMAKTNLRVTRPASPEIHGDKTFIPLEVQRGLPEERKVDSATGGVWAAKSSPKDLAT